jgi:hypothetical protein
MRRQKWLLLAITIALVLAFAGLSGCTEYRLSCCTEHQYEKGPVFFAATKTIGEGGPVKDDLIARGLYTHSVADDEEVIDIGGIKKLVEDGVYEIDEEGYLVFGPSYTPPP